MRYRFQWRDRALVAGISRLYEQLCEPCNSRRIKHGAQRHLHIQRFPYARNQLNGQERVSAERKKVVMNSRTINPEQPRPHTCKQLFGWIARRLILRLSRYAPCLGGFD